MFRLAIVVMVWLMALNTACQSLNCTSLEGEWLGNMPSAVIDDQGTSLIFHELYFDTDNGGENTLEIIGQYELQGVSCTPMWEGTYSYDTESSTLTTDVIMSGNTGNDVCTPVSLSMNSVLDWSENCESFSLGVSVDLEPPLPANIYLASYYGDASYSGDPEDPGYSSMVYADDDDGGGIHKGWIAVLVVVVAVLVVIVGLLVGLVVWKRQRSDRNGFEDIQ